MEVKITGNDVKNPLNDEVVSDDESWIKNSDYVIVIDEADNVANKGIFIQSNKRKTRFKPKVVFFKDDFTWQVYRERVDYLGRKQDKQVSIKHPRKIGKKDAAADKYQVIGESFKKDSPKAFAAMDIDRLKCRVCGLCFSNAYMLRLHINTHFGEHSCKLCDKKFTNLTYLKRHEKRMHTFGKFCCKICKEDLKSWGKLEYHMMKHDNRLICPSCKFNFKTKRGYQEHLKHKSCLKCPFPSEFRGSLIPQSERKFICDFCNKACRRKDFLILHIQRHHMDKTFICKNCGSAFHTKPSLRQHHIKHCNTKRICISKSAQ